MIFAVDLVHREFDRDAPGFRRAFLSQCRELDSAPERPADVGRGRDRPAARSTVAELVTSHDAFGYFAHDYGFTVHPINGLSTESEADAKHLAGLVDLIRRERIRAIFVESSTNPRLVENILGETGARLGGTLYADGMGPSGSGAETYDSMFRHNVEAIVSALSGALRADLVGIVPLGKIELHVGEGRAPDLTLLTHAVEFDGCLEPVGLRLEERRVADGFTGGGIGDRRQYRASPARRRPSRRSRSREPQTG